MIALLLFVAFALFLSSEAVRPDGELEMSDYLRAEMNEHLFQGDIVLPPNYERNAIRGDKYHWPGARIPYVLEPAANFNVYEQETIAEAMLNYARYTCIRWVPKQTTDNDYAHIINGGGCYSYVGRQGGRQDISLQRPDATGASCMIPGIAQHEMMHCSGFFHEQSRPDRDEYVNIYFDNISPGRANNFDRCSSFDCETLNAPYDYSSVMHYSNLSFSKDPADNLYTILPKVAGAEIGQRKGFSWIDVFKLNAYYGCPVPMNVPGPIDQNANPNVCNFDTNLCGWIQDYRVVLNPNITDPYPQYIDQFDFFRISGTTPSANTGPNGDHTTGNGRYIYAEASSPQETGDMARIRTPLITGTGTACISFWYSMYANDPSMMGTLNVYTQATTDTQRQLKWTKSGRQQTAPGWSQARFTVTVNGQFQVLFEAVRGTDFQSDIGIDDFVVTNGICVGRNE